MIDPLAPQDLPADARDAALARRAADRRSAAEAVAARLPPLLVAAERVASTVAQGVHGRRRVGMGESFWQFRRYETGDSAQRIDWRQSAKRDAPFVRETEWEASQTVHLWRDDAPSMAYASAKGLVTKRERAEVLVLALAVLLVRAGERVALIGGSVRPGASRATLERMAMDLVEAPPAAPGEAAEGGPDLRAQGSSDMPPPADLPRHSDCVLFGDFLAALPEIADRVAFFAGRGVRGHLVQVLDPAEVSLPFQGRIRFTGLDRATDEALIPRVETIRALYGERLAAQRAGLAAICDRHGWSFTTHTTDQPASALLLSLFTRLGRVEGVGPATDPARAGA